MTNQNEKSQLLNKLLRWVFVFILVISLLQIPLFTILRDTNPSFDMGEKPFLFLAGATIIGVILIAIVLFAFIPIVTKLFDIRKKEKEDPGMFV